MKCRLPFNSMGACLLSINMRTYHQVIFIFTLNLCTVRGRVSRPCPVGVGCATRLGTGAVMAWPRTEDTRAEHGLVTPTSQHTLATDNWPRLTCCQDSAASLEYLEYLDIPTSRVPHYTLVASRPLSTQRRHTASMMDDEQISGRRWSWCGCSVWSLGACVDFNIQILHIQLHCKFDQI